TRKRHERNDVHRAEARVLALVRAHVDLDEGGCDEGVRGGGHRVGVAGEGEDGAVVIDVTRLIEEPDPGDVADGLRQSVDHLAAAAFADVRHALHQPRHGASVPVIPHPWGLSACRRLVRLTRVERDRDRNEQGLSLALLQFNPSSVVLLDTEGRIRALNRNAERLLSTTEAEAIGKSYTVVFGESLSQRVFRLMLKGGAEGAARAIEATLPGGRRVKLRATAGPLKDTRGFVNGMVFVADEDTSSPKLASLAENQVRLRDALWCYLGDNVADMVDARPSFVDVGGQTQTVSVVHADVRGYS